MAAKPSPRLDALREMREQQFAKLKPVKSPKKKPKKKPAVQAQDAT